MKTKLVIGYSTQFSKQFQHIFNEKLLVTVGLTGDEIAIIPYENDGSLSLTEAYNDLWECASVFKDAIVVFIHHDVYFKSQAWGKTILNLFNQNELDILGLVGADTLYEHCAWWMDREQKSTATWGRIWHLIDGQEQVADYTSFVNSAKGCPILQPVVTIDGLFIAFNPDTCLTFDEDMKGFHFYDVSFCVRNFLAGKRLAVTETIQICHESSGNLNADWQEKRLKFYEKYGSYLPLSIYA